MAIDRPDGGFTPGPAWWYWLGGRPALDLVNTRRERWRRDVDCLTSPDDVVGWLVRAQLLARPQPAPPRLLHEARELREAIDAGVRACVAGVAPDATALALIDEWLAFAGGRPQLRLGPDGVPVLGERAPSDSPRRALGMVALDAARMLGTPAERARIRICASDTCSARFYDRSPAGRRRWCSMQGCGNVAKARRHRARLAATATEETT
jgi:predicted RNA-binding Zn ribbon-like protein